MREQVLAHGAGEVGDGGVGRALPRIDAGDDVAVDVAAGRDGVQHRIVQALDGGTQIALDDAVELDGLARGQAQRAVAALLRDAFGRQPLLRREYAAWNAQARHEDEGLFHLLASALGAQIAVVLHIDAVELGQLLIVIGQRAGFDAGQAIDDGAAQEDGFPP